MAYIGTAPLENAGGQLAKLYEQDRAHFGYVANYTQAFSARPEVITAWRGLVGSIRGNMDLRRFELATLSAAKALRSSYCMLAHGSILEEKFYSSQEVADIAADYRAAGLSPIDEAVMAYAEKVARHADQVTQEDIDGLRSLGLSDEEILDVALTAAARAFFSKVLDAVGAEPDAAYAQLDARLRGALVIGRPIAAPPRQG